MATAVLGQTGTSLSSTGCQANLMANPNSVAVDSNGGVFVADTKSDRVVGNGPFQRCAMFYLQWRFQALLQLYRGRLA